MIDHGFLDDAYNNDRVEARCLGPTEDTFKMPPYTPPAPPVVRNKYMREIAPGVWVDVYDVLYAFGVTDPCLQHLLKKALATGLRGHKDTREDLIDIRDSAIRAVEHYDKFNKA